MSDTTKIQWADATFNPWIGCTKVSAGCKNCYAENTTRARVLRSQGHETWGKGAQRSRTSAATWRKPILWNQQPWICDACGMAHAMPGAICLTEGCECETRHNMRVFPSLCDWLDDEVPIEWLADFLKLIHDTPNLDWLLLTKRPENWLERMQSADCYFRVNGGEGDVQSWIKDWWEKRKSPSNIWPGISAENQEMYDERWTVAQTIPAKVLFVSAEPLLGPIRLNYVTRKPDWIIYGGESGPHSRPCSVEWIRDGVKQCQVAGVKAFVKQLGSNPFCENANDFEWPDDLELEQAGTAFASCRPLFKDKKGGDISEFPDDLKVREMP